MATAEWMKAPSRNGYPTSDGRPMAETDHHRILMIQLIQTLEAYFAANPMVYVSGNLLLFYEQGDKRRHLAPDVFVVKGVPKKERLNYLTWEERKGPDVVIELTLSSTRREDTHKKRDLYQDTLRVPEYFLFDPFGDYLHPALQGYRLRGGAYVPIKPIAGRLPSKVLELHFEQRGPNVRLFDPATEQLLPTLSEQVTQAELNYEQEQVARQQAEIARERAEIGQERAELEILRLQNELADLRRRLEREA